MLPALYVTRSPVSLGYEYEHFIIGQKHFFEKNKIKTPSSPTLEYIYIHSETNSLKYKEIKRQQISLISRNNKRNSIQTQNTESKTIGSNSKNNTKR